MNAQISRHSHRFILTHPFSKHLFCGEAQQQELKWNGITQQGKSTYNTRRQNLPKKQEQRVILFKSPSNSFLLPSLPLIQFGVLKRVLFCVLITPIFKAGTPVTVKNYKYDWQFLFLKPYLFFPISLTFPFQLLKKKKDTRKCCSRTKTPLCV